MSLNERKQKILKAVIDDYISFAEPVGSSHIVKNHDMPLSSATIRNELADLEEQGYLVKPHTSAGRIPSYMGYRTYVDSLMEKYLVSLREIDDLKAQMNKKISELDIYIKRVLEIASKHTGLATVAFAPDLTKGTIKKIELMMLDSRNIVVILVTDSSIVKSRHIRLEFDTDTEFLKDLKEKLNENLAGFTIEEITGKSLEDITRKMNNDHAALSEIIGFIYSTITEMNGPEMYLSGETNMLSLPEFHKIEKAKEFLDLVHDKSKMKEIIIPNVNKDILKVFIGDEIEKADNLGLSLVLSPYKITDSVFGAIGFIGPTRMDYGKAVSSAEYISKALNEGLERNE